MLGLIGGLGLEAGMHYYRKLYQLESDNGRNLSMVTINADVRHVLGLVSTDDIESLTDYLLELTTRLQGAGATLVAIAAVTPHVCFDMLSGLASVPMVSLLSAVREECSRRRARTALLVGTRSVMTSGLFGALPGTTLVALSDDELTTIDTLYRTIVQSPEQRGKASVSLMDLVRRKYERTKPDVVVIAATDLSPALENVDTADLPLIDASAAHIRSILQRLH